MIIYLDMDEVCWDSIEAVLIILNKRYGTNFKPSDVNTWNFTNCFPNMTSEEIEEIFKIKEFFDVVTWKKDCLDFIYKHKNDIRFITKGHTLNLLQKMDFLTDFFDKSDINKMFIGLDLDDNKNKYMVSKESILIDDNIDNLKTSNAEINILFENIPNAEWNDGWKGLRVRSFQELDYLLDKFMIL